MACHSSLIHWFCPFRSAPRQNLLPKSLDSISPDELYREPNLEPVVRFDKRPLRKNIPEHAIVPVWLGDESQHFPYPMLKLIFFTDFGESFLPSTTQRYHSHTPGTHVLPEVHFSPEEPLSFPSDIWSLACTMPPYG